MTKKQLLYLEMLELVLPYARNVQTWPFLDRVRIDLYPELELIHNIPVLLRREEIAPEDVYWMNAQACNYLLACNAAERPHSRLLEIHIRSMLALVPDDLRHLITREPARGICAGYV